MDAVKFLDEVNEVKRMCAMYNSYECRDCPLNDVTPYGDICRFAIMSSLTSEDHPPKTNREKFFEVFGNSLDQDKCFTEDGYFQKWLDKEYSGQVVVLNERL